MLKNRRISLGLAALTLSLAAAAHADTAADAWASAKGTLPPTPTAVIGINFATIKGSQLFQQLFPTFLEQAGDAKKRLDDFKTECGLDIFAALQSIVIVGEDGDKGGAVFMSAKGVDKSKVEGCLTKMAAKDGKTLTIGKSDAAGIASYSIDTSDHFALAFLPKGVIAGSDTPEHLSKYLGGHGVTGGSPTAKALGGVNSNAAIWFVVTKEQQTGSPCDVQMKALYGNADFTGGNITADVRVITPNAKAATDFSSCANKQVDEAKKSGQLPPQVASVIKSLKIGSASEEVQFKASMAEKEALSLIGMAMGGGGGAPPKP